MKFGLEEASNLRGGHVRGEDQHGIFRAAANRGQPRGDGRCRPALRGSLPHSPHPGRQIHRGAHYHAPGAAHGGSKRHIDQALAAVHTLEKRLVRHHVGGGPVDARAAAAGQDDCVGNHACNYIDTLEILW